MIKIIGILKKEAEMRKGKMDCFCSEMGLDC